MSGYGVAVHALDYAGGMQAVEVNTWFRVEEEPIVVIGDLVQSHGDAPHSPMPPMVEGSAWFRVGGIPVSRAGHHAACGHATTGRPWFRIAP